LLAGQRQPEYSLTVGARMRIEVLYLIAAGLSNREIADVLEMVDFSIGNCSY